MLNAAVIGVGKMGTNHAKVYSRLKGIKFMALCDSHKWRVEKLARKIHIPYFTDYRKLISMMPEIDLVSIAVPTKNHKEVASFFMKNGVHVLLEKPIAGTVKEARQLITLSQRNKVKLLVGHIERFNPAFEKLKSLLRKNYFGKILSVSTKRIGSPPSHLKDLDIFSDLAIHDVDIINSLLGDVPNKINKKHGKLFGRIDLSYGKVKAHIEVDWLSHKRTRTLSINGTKGTVSLNYLAQTLKVKLFKSNKIKNFKIKRVDPLYKEIEKSIECIKNNEEPAVKPEEAFTALKICLS